MNSSRSVVKMAVLYNHINMYEITFHSGSNVEQYFESYKRESFLTVIYLTVIFITSSIISDHNRNMRDSYS